MRWNDIALRLRTLFNRQQAERDLQDELQFHLDMLARKNAASVEAQRQARVDFGSIDRVSEECRDARGISAIETLAKDFRYGYRLCRRNWRYALAVMTILAVGIAINVITFSLLKALTLAPLGGVEQSGSLLFIGARTSGGMMTPISFPDYKYIQQHAFAGLAGWAIQPLIVSHESGGQQVTAEFVTGNYFSVLKVTAQQGRMLEPSDTSLPGQQSVVVLSDGLWRRSFGADPGIVGATVRINAQPMTVVGIAASDFRGAIVGLSTEIFVPITMQPLLFGSNWLDSWENRWVHAFMRPMPGSSRFQIEAQARAVSEALVAEHAVESLPQRANIVSFWRWPYGAQSYMLPAVGFLEAMSALLLVAVSANLAGLALVRSLGRRGEVAARLALGASSGRVVTQLLIESSVLVIPSAAIGFLLAQASGPFFGAAAAHVALPLAFNVYPDKFLITFTIVLAVVTALMYGLVPALRLSRVDLASTLKDEFCTSRRAHSLVRTALVVAQIAVGVLLLVGTTLILRSFQAAQHANTGFEPRHVTWASFDVRAGGYDEKKGRLLYRRLLDTVRAEYGVNAASLATYMPLTFVDWMSWNVKPEGHQPRRDQDLVVAVNVVSTDYLRAMRIPLLAGRDFEKRDEDVPDPPLVVNETFARRFWGSPSGAVGRRVTANEREFHIIGVAGDMKYARLDEAPRPYMYAPFSHFYMPSMTLQIRASIPSATLLERVRKDAAALDANLMILNSGMMADQIRSATSLYETLARILSVVGLLAVALATLGVYGLVSYTVKERAYEMGVRSAVGATRTMILGLFVRHGVRLAAIGTGIGIGISLVLGHLMSNLLYGVDRADISSIASASLLMLISTFAACLVPAWHGARTNSLILLRRP